MISGETDINGLKGNGQTNEDRHTEQWTGQTDRPSVSVVTMLRQEAST